MRSYQPERSLYAALWCYAHGHAGMQLGRMQSERMQSKHTHTPSLFFPSIMILHDQFLHTPALQEEKDRRISKGSVGDHVCGCAHMVYT